MITAMMNCSDAIVDVDYVLKFGDPRVMSYPLMDSLFKTIAFVIVYLVFVKIIGPMLMKNRKPFSLRIPMLLYNALLVALSGWMFYRFAAYGWFHKFNWICEPIDFSNDDGAVKMLEAFYVYYISKYIEFLDTIFFVLRKKYSQVTFLHTFHHAYMPITTWYYVKYGCGGYATMLPFANCFTHVLMYSYYLLSSLGPSVQKYIWWKRHITNIQMIQFVFIMALSGLAMIIRPDSCNLRFFTAGLTFMSGFIFFCLFTPFYIDQYIRKKKT